MELYITELSKYVINLLMALYAYESFAVFRCKEESRRNGIYTRQNLLMLFIHFSCFMVICFETGDMSYLIFYAFQQIVLFATAVLFHMIYPGANRLMINNMCMLLSVGFVMLTRLSYERAVKQFVIVAFSIAAAMVIPFFVHKLKFLKRLTWVYALTGIAALSVVLVLGSYTYGSKISYSIAGLTFQPSEFVKILFVFFIASALCESTSFLQVCLTAVTAGIHVAILVVSRDLGSALIFFVVYVLMVFVATKNPLYLLAGTGGGSAAAVIAYKLFGHVQVRVQAWRDPWSEIDKGGYQITQSLFAISSGGWFGLGLFEGTPQSIPFVEADFIFSAIAEELGIVFAMCLILVCLSCFIMFMDISMKLNDRFYRLIAFGLGVTYIFQVFLTIGGGSKFIPLTGVTLPLISYGGSSVLTTLVMFAVVAGLCMVRNDEEMEEQQERRAAKGQRKKRTVKREQGKGRESTAVTYLFTAVFLGMMFYICQYSMVHRQELLNNSYHGRQQLLTARNTRGTIYAGSGEVLARTVTDSEGRETREYPYENLFAHAVGYATHGRAGVEALGNYYLIQSNAPLSEKVSAEVAGSKYAGDDVYTTLDVGLQEVAYKAMGVYRGAVIVSETSTGKILAMVSKPDFDPNGIEDIWDGLVEDNDSGTLLNRVTQGMYPPGSTFKIVTALEYIRENPDTYQDYGFSCSGSYSDGADRINCYHGQSHGQEDFARAFAKSCNSAFADIGVQLDRGKFQDTLQELLFNQELPVTMNYNKSRIDVRADSSNAEMMQLAIGQGTTGMSPIHLNMITNAIANEGLLMEPYLIDRVQNSIGTVIKQFSPSSGKRLMTKEEAAALNGLMQGVVEEGTASRLKGLSYTAAGKTGSAEYSNVKEESHAWFTGFAPAQNPEISVTIIIEGAGSGGDYAVPIAKRIFDAYFHEE